MKRHALVRGNFRYWLTREWDEKKPRVTFIGLNPSTADAFIDDATIRKEVGFAQRWGFGSLLKLNMYPYRATHPRDLIAAEDRIGRPDLFIGAFRRIEKGETVVCAWGATRIKGDEMHRKGVLNFLWSLGADLRALDITKDGEPKHPLYISYEKKLIELPRA